MVGPSARGSLKGMPISTMSTLPFCSALSVSAVLSSVGCPAQKYTERMPLLLCSNKSLILFIAVVYDVNKVSYGSSVLHGRCRFKSAVKVVASQIFVFECFDVVDRLW